MATIRDVAKECGVSVTTVSSALNNSSRPVHSETRRRVSEAARRLNYHPSATARGLVKRRMNTLGVLFASVEEAIVTNSYATGILGGVFAESAAQGHDIHLFTNPWRGEESAPRFQNSQADGVLLIVPTIGSDMVSALRRFNVPMVVVSSPTTVAGVSFVDVDNAHGARMAAEHLLSLGHKRIAHLMGDTAQHSVLERRDAFVSTLKRGGVTVPPGCLVGDSFAAPDVNNAVQMLLSVTEPPTAVFCSNDDLAFALIRAVQGRGISVPEELSVIGFDDAPFAKQSHPPLTTIGQPLWEIGRKATQLLLARIGDEAITDERHLFAPTLIVRETTASPK
ncbi:MAG: LacI family DNA-binding transcriptional regulator [Armatimonadetes bacterium]|nr:LacI family DNA-binding transcriptional regulator [Armatimonadota bacterium]